ncbi:MAG: serine/threonine-protein phosphatase [Oscillospiraceae bacterium]|jgi:protein phosphatase|nr:serine/threonine-protein phosphatase [Oscillospiraceae bacterium]
MTYETAFRSILGTRGEQQDCGFVQTHSAGVFAAVFDGMGGMESGAAASAAAAETLRALYRMKPPAQPLPLFFWEAVDILDECVVRLGRGEGQAGTTVTAVAVEGNQLHWLSVGDSRLYLLRGGEVVRVTRDHNGYLLGPEAPGGKGEALISYLGLGGVKVFDSNQTPFPLLPGDTMLLTTDGLTKTLADRQIWQALQAGGAQDGMDALFRQIELTHRPSQDNTTCAVIQCR